MPTLHNETFKLRHYEWRVSLTVAGSWLILPSNHHPRHLRFGLIGPNLRK